MNTVSGRSSIPCLGTPRAGAGTRPLTGPGVSGNIVWFAFAANAGLRPFDREGFYVFLRPSPGDAKRTPTIGRRRAPEKLR